MSNTTSPALPAFSYAQAARGLPSGNMSQQKSVESSAASSEKGPAERAPSSADGTKVEAGQKSSEIKSETSSLPSSVKDSEQQHGSAVEKKQIADNDSAQISKRSGPSAAEIKTAVSPTAVSRRGSEIIANLPKEEDFALNVNGTSDSWEKQSEASTSVSKGTQTADKEKSQAADEDWEKVSVPSVQDKELKAAPLPVVNIWQQRMEALDAKHREQASQRPPSAPATTNVKPRVPSSGVSDPVKGKMVEKGVQLPERDSGQKRKQPESGKQANDRRESTQAQHARPQSRDGQTTAEPLQPPPPVGDAAAWPTPLTATAEERRKSSSIEVNDKAETQPTGSKAHKKDWTKLAFVPSAVFQTPLPPGVASKRGGRGGNRGRDGTGRGGHMSQNSTGGDKSEHLGLMGPPPLPRQGNEQERGRKQDGARGGRATSVPTQGSRAASAAAPQTEPRKVSGNQHGFGSARADARRSPNLPESTEGATSSQTQGSRPSSRPTDAALQPMRNGDADAKDSTLTSHNTHAHPSIDAAARETIPVEWYKGKSSNANGRGPSDPSTERNHPRPREWSNNSRDKVESWREQSTQNDQGASRGQRSERGRGSYRGRGNNTTYGLPPAAHAFTAPLPQQPFSAHRASSYNESRQRQGSQQFPIVQPVAGSRHNLRSQSIPLGVVPQQMTNGMPGMSQPLSPLQTDMAMYGYPQAMHPAMMSAVPYNPALDAYGLLAMVTIQLDYYFSIDNLCKDVFLRKNMDSRGFVLLSTIAGFKRIEKLTRDMETLRYVCANSPGLEYRQGDDGEDRVRRREGWQQWVLPNLEDRVEAARNDGPSSQASQPRRSAPNGFNIYSDSPLSAAGPMRSPTWVAGGYGEYAGPMSPPLPITSAPSLDGAAENQISQLHQVNQMTMNNSVLGMDVRGVSDQVLPSEINGDAYFSPSLPAANGIGSSHVLNGHGEPSSMSQVFDQENVFPNDQISKVYVYERKRQDDALPLGASFAEASSQSLLADPTNDPSTSATVSGLRGGAGSVEQLRRLHSQDMNQSAPYAHSMEQDGTFVLKDGISQSDFHQEASDAWHYQTVHSRAVEQRNQGFFGSENHEMELLFQFWADFLVKNFNTTMYKDFVSFATEDLRNGSTNGSEHLAKYYGQLLSNEKPLTDRFAHDIVTVVSQESGKTKPVFQSLRSAWRNGAFNLKSRKRIDSLLDTGLRTQLEK